MPFVPVRNILGVNLLNQQKMVLPLRCYKRYIFHKMFVDVQSSWQLQKPRRSDNWQIWIVYKIRMLIYMTCQLPRVKVACHHHLHWTKIKWWYSMLLFALLELYLYLNTKPCCGYVLIFSIQYNKINCNRIFFSLYTSDTLWSWLFPIINLCESKVISFYEISLYIHYIYIYISSNIYHLTLWNFYHWIQNFTCLYNGGEFWSQKFMFSLGFLKKKYEAT